MVFWDSLPIDIAAVSIQRNPPIRANPAPPRARPGIPRGPNGCALPLFLSLTVQNLMFAANPQNVLFPSQQKWISPHA